MAILSDMWGIAAHPEEKRTKKTTTKLEENEEPYGNAYGPCNRLSVGYK